MAYLQQLLPLADIAVSREEILAIKRHDLVPILQDQAQLNYYAERLVQAQSVLLNPIDPKLTQDLSHTIQQLIQALNDSKKYIKTKKFNRLQRWLGSELDFASKQIAYYAHLERLIQRSHDLSAKLQVEMQKSAARYHQLVGLREQMAKYIRAGKEFLREYPEFVKQQHPLDQFAQRLSKKINTLETLQSSNDIAMQQMYVREQLALGLLDRFKEAEQVLLPAWQYHLQHSQTQNVTERSDALDASRNRLIHTLKHALEQSSQSSHPR